MQIMTVYLSYVLKIRVHNTVQGFNKQCIFCCTFAHQLFGLNSLFLEDIEIFLCLPSPSSQAQEEVGLLKQVEGLAERGKMMRR